MTRVIIFERPGGEVTARNPSWGVDMNEGETEEEYLGRVAAKNLKGRIVAIVERSELPTYDALRDAWRASGNKVRVDIPVAREIVRKRRAEAGLPQRDTAIAVASSPTALLALLDK